MLPEYKETIARLREYKRLIKTEGLVGETALAFDIDSNFMQSRRWEYGWAISQIFKAHSYILDIGSGYRPFTLLLSDLGHTVTAVDNESWAIHEDLHRKLESKGIHYVKADAEQFLPFSKGAFDTIFCISVLEHIKYPEKLIAEAMRVLEPGGKFIITLDYSERLWKFKPEEPMPGDIILNFFRNKPIVGIKKRKEAVDGTDL